MMKKLLITTVASVAAIAMAPTVMAQDAEMEVVLTTPQQAMYDGWPMENQAMYDAWPAEVQTYYWTLTEPQMQAWWQLNDGQRVAIYRMEPTQRAATWQSITQKMSPGMASKTSDIRYQSNAVVQKTPASSRAQSSYPICKGDVQDDCMQPRAAGKNWGNRPLDYWPGKPASEMKKKGNR